MSLQTFKTLIPKEMFFAFLDQICMKNEKHYILDHISFKRGIFNGIIQVFFEECKPYYHNSKRKYIERKLTYTAFTTVIRQICNSNNITYTSQIKYDKSKYDIVYIIYF